MKRKVLALGIVQLFLLGLSLKSCTVSMDEPFKVITIRGLLWQVIGPSVIATSMIWLGSIIIMSNFLGESHRKWKVLWLALTLVMLLASLEPIYGYVWDMKVHMGIH